MKVLKFMTVAAMLATFFAVVVMVSAVSPTAGYDQFDAGTGSARQAVGISLGDLHDHGHLLELQTRRYV